MAVTIAALAVVVGVGLLALLAVATARQKRAMPGVRSGADGGDLAWMSGVGGDSGADSGGDCGAADGGGCGGDGGGGGD